MCDDKLLIGMALGFMVGAIVVSSSKKAQNLMEQGKEKLKEKVEKL